MKGLGEEESFWVLVYIIEELMPREYYTNMLALRADIQLVHKVLEVKDPEMLDHLRSHMIDLSLLTVESFLTIYTNTCHTNITDVIIDHFLMKGPVVLLKTIIIMLGYMREDLFKQESFGRRFFR
jgi:hypothetical protein